MERLLSAEVLVEAAALVAVLSVEREARAMSALSSGGDRVVPVLARELAARLSALFERDVEIVKRVNDAQRRVREANERLWSGLSPDAFGVAHDGAGPAGSSEIAALMMDGARDARDRGACRGAADPLVNPSWLL